jgi:serine O-acetyltransferase
MEHAKRQLSIDALMTSYETLGVVNLSDKDIVPSRQSIVDILTLLKELLFPGFFGAKALSSSDLATITGKRVISVIENFSEEIHKSFKWSDRDLGESTRLSKDKAIDIVSDLITMLPSLRDSLKKDAQAIFEGDPASTSLNEVILAYPGFQAVLVYRLAHYLFKKNVPIIPRLMSEIVHSETGIDIHPGATIGESFFIDHGTGIVVGETAEIGHHVKLYQGVTLGAFSVSKDTKGRRHPKLGNHVTVYARSTILGGDSEVGDHCVIGGNVWLTHSLPAHSTIYMSSDFKPVVKSKKHD